ncbi:MAG: SGNH/GDSL hydrolase family protein [Candidatus Obscuribacterales bacterium]|nr:SGNH/GDSL hydrolase family protein [Candidatus Obscuribacterales bacterium]
MQPVVSLTPNCVKSVEQAQSRPARNIIVLCVTILVVQVFALFSAEMVLYFAGIGEEDISVFDPDLGFRHRSHKRVTWRQEGFSQGYFGQDGLRAPTLPAKAPGVYRVILLGDSFVEGLQEPYEVSFAQQMQERLHASTGKQVEVLNFGTVGYSTVQEYLLLKEMLPKYSADAVILAYTPRDMAETLETWAPANMKPIGSRPFALKAPGKPLEISNLPVLNAAAVPSTKLASQFEWFRQNSRLWGYFSVNKPKFHLKNAVFETVGAIAHDPAKGLQQMIRPLLSSADASFQIQFFEQNKKDQQTQKQARANAATLRRPDLTNDKTGVMRKAHLQMLDDTFGELAAKMNQLCTSNGARLTVLLTPCRSALLPPTASVPAPAPPLYNVSYADEIKFVTRHGNELGVPVVNAQESASRLQSSEIERMYFVHHPTRHGNKFLADCMVPVIQRMMRAPSELAATPIQTK